MGQLLVMPKLGLTMTEGTIVEWFKKEGEEVKKGEKLFAVETSKLTNEVEAPASGVLRKIIHKDGKLAVLEPVGILAGADEDISDLLKKAGSSGNLDTEKKVEKMAAPPEKPALSAAGGAGRRGAHCPRDAACGAGHFPPGGCGHRRGPRHARRVVPGE